MKTENFLVPKELFQSSLSKQALLEKEKRCKVAREE